MTCAHAIRAFVPYALCLLVLLVVLDVGASGSMAGSSLTSTGCSSVSGMSASGGHR